MIGINAVPRSEWVNQAQWALTAPLLALQLAGHTWALPVVLGLCGVSLLHYGTQLRSVRPYRVQIRIAFMVFCSLAYLPGLAPILWIPVFGTTAQVLFGYCPMARLLDLTSWNRSRSLSWAEVKRVVMRAPGQEGLVRLPSHRTDRYSERLSR